MFTTLVSVQPVNTQNFATYIGQIVSKELKGVDLREQPARSLGEDVCGEVRHVDVGVLDGRSLRRLYERAPPRDDHWTSLNEFTEDLNEEVIECGAKMSRIQRKNAS